MIADAAARAVARFLDRLAAGAAETLPDVTVEHRDDTVVLTGPRLLLRRVTDARLRLLAAHAVQRP